MTESFLLIAHADEPRVTLLDHRYHVVRTFEMPGRVAVLGASSDKDYGFAIHRDDDCVTIIDPQHALMKGIVATGKQPTHFHAHDTHSIIFNDGSGDVAIFDETDLPHFIKVPVTQPDHGSALLIGDEMLVGYLRLGTVEVYRRGEQHPCQTFDCCPMLHGATQVGAVALFGCGDGVLLLKREGAEFVMSKLNNPDDTPPRVRVGVFATHPQSSLALGNFGQGLAIIDTRAASMRTFALPDTPLKFSFAANGQSIMALTSDGVLHRLSFNGTVEQSQAVAQAVAPPKGPDKKARPTFTVGDEELYMIDPETHQLKVIQATDLTTARHIQLDFKPAAIIHLKA